jgi:hypothetical protein
MQLDIFNDSRDVMMRNDVPSALQQYDAAAARRALHVLENDYPEDDALVQLGLIADALEARSTVCGPRTTPLRGALRRKLCGREKDQRRLSGIFHGNSAS